jgi:AraC-like DNA-binding protein
LNLLFVDLVLRGSSSGVALVAVFLLVLSPVPKAVKISFALTIVTHLCRQWSVYPSGLVLQEDASLILRRVGSLSQLFFTWFLLTVFLDERRYFWVWIASGVVIFIGLLLLPVYRDFVPLLRIHGVLHFCGLVALILLSSRDDLLQRRRIARVVVSILIILYAVFLAIFARPMVPGDDLIVPFISNLVFFVALLTFITWVFQVNPKHWIGEVTAPEISATDLNERRVAQTALTRKIEISMQGGIWQQEGLTVGKLAAAVGAPEHQVRKAINQTLGFRNFSSFINASRIEAAQELLTSPEHATMSVQEVAYGVGYSSLGPFNRAFRDLTGQSPSEYRASHEA